MRRLSQQFETVGNSSSCCTLGVILMLDIKIRPLVLEELSDVAAFIAAGYSDDIFFEWVVPSELARLAVVTEY